MSGLRVVSLVPSTTETLLAWGVDVVACTRFCEQPGLRTVGGTKDPDIGAIVALAPDLVVVNDEENRRLDADALAAAGLAVHACSPRSVAEVGPALDALAAAVGVDPPEASRGRVEDASGSGVPPAGQTGDGPSSEGRLGEGSSSEGQLGDGPSASAAGEGRGALPPLDLRAFVPIWWRPLMSLAGDTYGSSVLDAIGVTNVFAESADRYPEVTMAEAAAARPDVVLAPSEPYAFRPRHLEALAEVAPVVPVDGQDLFWWGVRTPAAVARLHAALAPLF